MKAISGEMAFLWIILNKNFRESSYEIWQQIGLQINLVSI